MIEQRERLTENLNVRAAPSDVRRLEAAAELAGCTRSALVRHGFRQAARKVLREAATEDGDGERR